MQTQRESASPLFKTPCLWYLLWQPELIKARLLYFPLCLPNPFFMLLFTAMLNHVLTFPSLALTSWWRARLYLLLDLCTFFSFLNTEKRKHVRFPEHFSFLYCFKTGQIIWGEFSFSLGLIEVARAVSEISGKMSVSKKDNRFWVDEMRILEGRSQKMTRTFSGKTGQIQNLHRCEGGSCSKHIKKFRGKGAKSLCSAGVTPQSIKPYLPWIVKV